LTRRGLTGRSLPPATISTETLSEPKVGREAVRS